MISRTQHSLQERDTRSRAAQLLANQPFLRGAIWYCDTAPAASPTAAANAGKSIRLSISTPARVRSRFAPTFPGPSTRRFANGLRTAAGSNDWSIKSPSRTFKTLLERKQPLLRRKGRSPSEDHSP